MAGSLKVNFVNLKDAGDPVEAAYRYDQAGADEICFLDINATYKTEIQPMIWLEKQQKNVLFL